MRNSSSHAYTLSCPSKEEALALQGTIGFSFHFISFHFISFHFNVCNTIIVVPSHNNPLGEIIMHQYFVINTLTRIKNKFHGNKIFFSIDEAPTSRSCVQLSSQGRQKSRGQVEYFCSKQNSRVYI